MAILPEDEGEIIAFYSTEWVKRFIKPLFEKNKLTPQTLRQSFDNYRRTHIQANLDIFYAFEAALTLALEVTGDEDTYLYTKLALALIEPLTITMLEEGGDHDYQLVTRFAIGRMENVRTILLEALRPDQ